MNRTTINELRKQIYDLAEVLRAEVGDEHCEIELEARGIMKSCEEIGEYLEPDDYLETIHDTKVWLDARCGV